MSTDPRYPLGKFQKPAAIAAADRIAAIATLRDLPTNLRTAIAHLTDAQLDTPYRDGGWTVRQLVHHVADSHMTAFHRVRLALTVDAPPVAAYDEHKFAVLPDSTLPLDPSLHILNGLHTRWVALYEALTEDQWRRSVLHSANGPQQVDVLLLLYAWHSRHHTAHITELRKTKGW